MSMSTSTPATRASRSRTFTWSCGMSPPATKPRSQNDTDAEARDRGWRDTPRRFSFRFLPHERRRCGRDRDEGPGGRLACVVRSCRYPHQTGADCPVLNRDAANSHTSTAYHPDLFGLPRRIPSGAPSWHSDYLLPEESFSVQFHLEGVYDYYCVPHAQAGMVGRIVVGEPHLDDWMGVEGVNEGISTEATRTFPDVEEILRKGFVTRV